MRYHDIWIAGTGGTLGDLVPIADAVADGRYSAQAAESTGMVSISAATEAPPEMAVTAGRQAIKDAAEDGVEVSPATLYMHSYGHFQGLEVWPAACFIAGQLLGPQLDEMPLTIDAASNGSLACLQIAAGMLTARPDLSTALFTLADRFAPPADRWYTSPGMVFGDGGAAAVLTRGGGRLRLLSVVSEADTVLEGLSRGNTPFHTTPEITPDLRRRTREFLARGEVSLRDVRARSAARVQSVVSRALLEADLTGDEVDWYVPPFVGRSLFQDSFVRPLGFTPRRTLAELGLTIGHLGAADHAYALHHLSDEGLLEPGERILLVGTGMGFTFSAAVLAADRV